MSDDAPRYRTVRRALIPAIPPFPGPEWELESIPVTYEDLRLPVVGKSGPHDVVQWPDGRWEVIQ